ncbi:MAG TPA: non-homologous end-joining DNA ligase [Mycobacteriales bacterium]|nr:non-homologous end-joining DNA ligase [Mycobacteriales bacterium]
MAASPFVELEIDTPTGVRTVKVTNPDKTYFAGLPDGQGRKLDLVQYYLAVDAGVVNALRDRPTVLKRHPDGADGEAIYQKRVPEHRPPWIETALVTFPSGRHAYELCVTDVAAVAWAANLGTLDFHPWPSRRDDTEHPDELRIDLDPQPGTDYADVVATALELQPLLDELGLVSWPKTSGSKGLHVYVRLAAGRYTFTDCRHAVLAIGRELERRRPELITTAWWKEERGERVFVDFNRMARDQTIASAYSVRARPQATVSAPLSWAEVPDARIGDFTIASMPARFAELGDVHGGMDQAPCTLDAVVELAERDRRDRGLGDAPYPPNHPKMPGEPLRVQPSRRKRLTSENGGI